VSLILPADEFALVRRLHATLADVNAEKTHGTWTVTLTGDHTEASHLATIIRASVGRHWNAASSNFAALQRLVAALERAEFTPEPEKP